MIELYLNNRRAIPKASNKIKITCVNEYFGSKSKRTLEIELPLSIRENQEIFGSINRYDAYKEKLKFNALLRNEAAVLIEGDATITQITDTSVKIQIKDVAAKYSTKLDNAEVYVDELALGDWFSLLNPNGSIYDDPGSAFPVIEGWSGISSEGQSGYYQFWLQNMFDGEKAVFYPVMNTSNNIMCNELVYSFNREKGTLGLEWPYTVDGDESTYYVNSELGLPIPKVKVAVQPRLYFICQEIAKACGYQLDLADNQIYKDEFLRRIILVNANIHMQVNRCLPHWTVDEWWKQIEALCGVAMVIDRTNKKTLLIPRGEKYALASAQKYYIEHVDDEYTVDLSEDKSDELSTANIAYDNDGISTKYLLPDEIMNKAELYKVNCQSIKELVDIATYRGINLFKNYLYETLDGAQHIYADEPTVPYMTEKIITVNQLRARMAREDSQTIDYTIKFLPCKISEHQWSIVERDGKDIHGKEHKELYVGWTNVMTLERPDLNNFSWEMDEATLRDRAVDISDLIIKKDAGESIDREKNDKAYIALTGNLTPQQIFWQDEINRKNFGPHDVKKPRPITVSERQTSWQIIAGDRVARWEVGDDNESSLSLVGAGENLGTIINKNKLNADGSIKYCFKFYADEIPQTDNLFIIKNIPYVCAQLELQIDDKGLSTQITGYFYRVMAS